MRCRGKALYTLNVDHNPHEDQVVSGFDASIKKNLELIVKNDTTGGNDI